MTLVDAPDRKLRVVVLMGGSSSERDVSLSTGKQILENLDREKYDVVSFDTLELTEGGGGQSLLNVSFPQPSNSDEIVENESGGALVAIEKRNISVKPDLAFIALHGKGGEDGTIQAFLEVIGIPYTFSGVASSAIAMDKMMAKNLFIGSDILTVPGLEISSPGSAMIVGEFFSDMTEKKVARTLGFPVFVKPNSGGSTFGCTLVSKRADLVEAIDKAAKFDEAVLIEKYLKGTEITVGVIGGLNGRNYTLPIIEIVPKGEFYDYESKYSEGGSEHIIPARISEELAESANEIALNCHSLLRCAGCSRTDMIIVRNKIYVLETNTIPGMTPTSLLPQAAAAAGISFPMLLDILIASAWNAEQIRMERKSLLS